MDLALGLLNETSNVNKTVVQRHIAGVSEHLEPIPVKMSNAINTTDVCHGYTIQPDFGTYLAGKKKNVVGKESEIPSICSRILDIFCRQRGFTAL